MNVRTLGSLLGVALLIGEGLPVRAWAQDRPSLILPLLSALALGRQMAEARAEARANPISARVGESRRARQGWLPDRLHIPDLYAIEYERDPLPFAAPVDEDTMVSFDLFTSRESGMRLRAAYDTETPPIGRGSDVLRLEIEIGF